jgi:hypothetical protein
MGVLPYVDVNDKRVGNAARQERHEDLRIAETSVWRPVETVSITQMRLHVIGDSAELRHHLRQIQRHSSNGKAEIPKWRREMIGNLKTTNADVLVVRGCYRG